jgi:two-component system, OmpR family, phosphate regulon sensor histidine kinase PhoR
MAIQCKIARGDRKEGGEIVIGARELNAGDGVECTVTDNGTGIPAEFLETIFEKGKTDSENEGGTGLGLAIVKTS